MHYDEAREGDTPTSASLPNLLRGSGWPSNVAPQDLTSLAVMAAWRGQVEEGRRCEAARSLACQKLIDVGRKWKGIYGFLDGFGPEL